MPKVVTFSVFLPSLSSSSAVCANAGPHAVHNSNAASRFFMIAPLVGGATLYPAPVRRWQQFRPLGGLVQQRHAQPVIDDKWLAESTSQAYPTRDTLFANAELRVLEIILSELERSSAPWERWPPAPPPAPRAPAR